MDKKKVYSLVNKLRSDSTLKEFPLNNYDSYIIPQQRIDGTSTPNPLSIYKEFSLFGRPNQSDDKRLIDSNLRQNGKVPDSETWFVNAIAVKIEQTNDVMNLNLHSMFSWALAQGIITMKTEEDNLLHIHANELYTATSPMVNISDRTTADTLISSWDVTTPPVTAPNSRSSLMGNTKPYLLESTFVFQAQQSITFLYNWKESAMMHISEFAKRSGIPELQYFVHDEVSFRIFVKGIKFRPATSAVVV